jgi:epoxyqueuosine reductase
LANPTLSNPISRSVSDKIKHTALDIGFDKVGFAKADRLDDVKFYNWLDHQYHAGMQYMQKYDRQRLDPSELLSNAKTVISLAINYNTPHKTSKDASTGRISRYAWGDDYHLNIKKMLNILIQKIKILLPNSRTRACIDTAPILEKQWAQKAGIGWQGKNTNILTKEFGSWIFLAEILIDTELEFTDTERDYCGSCTQCLDACPTGALVKPYVLDSRKCISYLTIELKPDKPIPKEYHGRLGNCIFGCDICQDVCPWNKKQTCTTIDSFQPRPHNVNPKLEYLINLTETDYQQLYKKSPIKRAKYTGFMRNIKIALQNKNAVML